MTTLPDPILRVRIPHIFSVSQIAAAEDCFLKVLIATQQNAISRLCPNPSAELGIVFHSFFEKAVKGLPGGVDPSLIALEALLDYILDETRTRLKKDPHTAAYANLKQTMTPLGWKKKRRSIVDTAFELATRVKFFKTTAHIKRGGGFSFKNARGGGHWAEVPIYVPTLRLRGRIDYLERKGNNIKIVDFKSGRIKDSDDQVNSKITLQLLLYGVMAHLLDPGANITLAVNNGTEHLVPFDSEVAEETKEWLLSTMSTLVSGAMVSAEKIAKVGPDCRWCDTRHCCVKYLKESPSLWTQEIGWRLPLDTWGTVERMTKNDNGLLDLKLMNAGGRRIKVFRVRETHLTKSVIGKRIWLFDLAVSRPALGGNSWRHPLNFHEISECDATDRAWSLQVFVG